ncbi:hypothetical protein [Spirosoma luteum]|uniref:hypothetical protein n=1 Tax=Spirosoma luteum TaxID=431553 RepID=UPI00037377EA|nr:hypothetical protein [Spirosoma luteum]
MYDYQNTNYRRSVWTRYKMSLLAGAVCLTSALLMQQCKQLGIGKQCYECTTEAINRPSYGKTVKEVCGVDEMRKYQKENSITTGGVVITTLCRNK